MRLTVLTKPRCKTLFDSPVVITKVLEEKKNQLHRCMNNQSNLTVFDQTDIDIMSECGKVNKLIISWGLSRYFIVFYFSLMLLF